jgi:hypothetical protein
MVERQLLKHWQCNFGKGTAAAEGKTDHVVWLFAIELGRNDAQDGGAIRRPERQGENEEKERGWRNDQVLTCQVNVDLSFG